LDWHPELLGVAKTEESAELTAETDKAINVHRSHNDIDMASVPFALQRQGLTLVKFTAQPEHSLGSFVTESNRLIPQKMLRLS